MKSTPFDLSKLSLRIMGDHVDPSQLTNLLGHAPSIGRKKGETWIAQTTGEQHEARDGRWIFHAPDSETGDLDGQINWIFSKLTDNLASWKRTTQEYDVDLFFRLFSKTPHPAFQLTAETIDEISLRGIKLDFEFHNEVE